MNQMLGSIGEVMMILGGLMTAAGAVLRIYLREKDPYKGRVTATVVELVADIPDSLGQRRGIHDYFYPVFAYYANGRLMKERYRLGSNPPQFYQGQKVQLKYDLNAPYKFELVRAEPREKLERLLYFCGIGCILAGFACYLLFGMRVLGG